ITRTMSFPASPPTVLYTLSLHDALPILFRYANATARPGLNRLLRMPLAPDRVVTDDGRPLARVAEPLRLNLRSPENGDGSYELRSEEHTSELQSLAYLVCRLLLEKKKNT